jgi:hypothetical protein
MTVAYVLAETGHGRDLPLPPWAFALLAFSLLTTLLLVTLSFGKDR